MSKNQFAALEMMSRQKAAVAKKEMEYWLAEADDGNSSKNLLTPL